MINNRIEDNNKLIKLLFKNELYLVMLFFLLAFFVRFFTLIISDNFMGDQPMKHIMLALGVLNLPIFSDFEIFSANSNTLPFYLYSLGLSWRLGQGQIILQHPIHGQIIAMQFTSLFLGSLTIVFYYFFNKKMFSKRTAIFSCILFGFYPFHVIRSVITLPDCYVIFFIFISLYFITLDRPYWSALFLGFATGYSYLAWILVPIITLFLLFYGKNGLKNYKVIIQYLFIGILFPIIFLFFLKYKHGNYALFQFSLIGTDYFSKISPIVSLLLVLLFLGMYGKFFSPKHEPLIILILLILFAGSFVFIWGDLVNFQIWLLAALLIMPFGIEVICTISDRFRLSSTVRYAIIFFLISLFISGIIYLKPALPDEIKQISSWLNYNMQDDDIVFVQKDDKGYYSSIIMLSERPTGNFYYKDLLRFNEFIKKENKRKILVIHKLNKKFKLLNTKIKKIFENYSIFFIEN